MLRTMNIASCTTGDIHSKTFLSTCTIPRNYFQLEHFVTQSYATRILEVSKFPLESLRLFY
nr:MAG TPA: hypothetical protein [Caudoviricetes sp.]